MKQYDLRVSNHNYGAAEFMARVQERFLRDKDFLGDVVQRSVLSRSQTGEIDHVITRIDVLHESIQMTALPEIQDYGTLLFVRETLTREALLKRLGALSERHFEFGQWSVNSTGVGFSDYYEPSQNQYGPWPSTVFHISLGRAQFPFDPLIHPTLRSFPSPYDAIREKLGFTQFNDSSDGRLGSIIMCVPNLNAHIEHLSLKGNNLRVRLAGTANPSSLKLDGNYKNEKEAASIEKHLDSKETVLELPFVPSELHLWLVSTQGFLADFHDENEYYSKGANPVLPKKTARGSSIRWEPESYDESVPVYETQLSSTKVFVIHGRNTSVKESVARFLEKLGLEAVVLHEQPNRGGTIIEKFELHSDVGFAVALLTGDDEARIVSSNDAFKRRPRQNVLFEFGYFIGKLGRNRVCALVEGDIEIPSDYQGVVYIALDQTGHWKFDLVRELKAVGFDVDANRAL